MPTYGIGNLTLLALSRFIGDPDVIDHFCGLLWGGLCPEPSLGPRADNVIMPLDLTQSFPAPVSRSLQVSLLASQPTESAAGGKPCIEPAISLYSHHVSLVQWTTRLLPATRDPGSNPQGEYLCGTGILLLALSRYNLVNIWLRQKYLLYGW